MYRKGMDLVDRNDYNHIKHSLIGNNPESDNLKALAKSLQVTHAWPKPRRINKNTYEKTNSNKIKINRV